MACDVAAAIAVFNVISFARGVTPPGSYIFAPLSAPIGVLLVSIYLIQGYRARTDMLSVDYASQHAIAALGAMIATLLITYVFVPPGYELQSSRAVIAVSFLTLAPLTLGYRRVLHLRTARARESKAIVFVGNETSRDGFREECRITELPHPVIYTHVEQEDAAGAPGDASSLRPFSDVLTRIESGTMEVEAIVLREAAGELHPDLSAMLVRLYFAGVPTYTLELFHEIYWQKIPLYRLNQTWLFQEGFKIAREPVYERAKRASDVVLASLGLAVGLPVLAFAALAIWLEDRGPVVFRQKRVGRNHVPFVAFKLRTMRTSASGSRYTQPGDSRITRVGAFLRASRIDEIPQMLNVLRGEMSLIGPRAEWDQLVSRYEAEIPCYHFRHLVRPGITGWAQVNYPYGANVADTLRKLEYDLYYIRHFSFRLDATIVFKTIHIMLFGKGR